MRAGLYAVCCADRTTSRKALVTKLPNYLFRCAFICFHFPIIIKSAKFILNAGGAGAQFPALIGEALKGPIQKPDSVPFPADVQVPPAFGLIPLLVQTLFP